MTTLAIFIVLISVVAVAESGCFFEKGKSREGADCVYQGVTIPNGTTRQVRCRRCSCHGRGDMSCCDVGGRIFHPPYCKTVSDGPCRKKAVMRNDPSVPCDRVSGTGRR